MDIVIAIVIVFLLLLLHNHIEGFSADKVNWNYRMKALNINPGRYTYPNGNINKSWYFYNKPTLEFSKLAYRYPHFPVSLGLQKESAYGMGVPAPFHNIFDASYDIH